MHTTHSDPGSCGPALPESPTDTWSIEQLTDYARMQMVQSISAGDQASALLRQSAIHRYHAGHAFVLIRDRLKPRRRWTRWQAVQHLVRSQVNDAIRLFESYRGMEYHLAEMTMTDALRSGGIAQGKPNSDQDADDEHYTPKWLVDAARSAMGGIDLDPASCELANQTVQAARFYSKVEDGLSRPWRGTVWLNPPFSNQRAWIEKGVAEFEAGNLEQIAILFQNTHFYTVQSQVVSALFLSSERIKFGRPNGEETSPAYGASVLYLGARQDAFRRVLESRETVLGNIRT